MQPIYILHCKGHRITSKLIKMVTGGEYTHSAILFRINAELCVLEMQRNGCELKTFENWLQEYNYDYLISYKPAFQKELSDILAYSGVKGYDFENFVFKQPFKAIKERLTGKKVVVKADKDEDKRYICSELVATIFGWENPQSYTPQNIYDRCVKEQLFISKKTL